MSIDKSLRAGERLYNAFWRFRFSALAGIPKESSGGRATQRDSMYRLSHFMNAVWRRYGSRLIASAGYQAKAGGDVRNFKEMYVDQCAKNGGLTTQAEAIARKYAVTENVGTNDVLTTSSFADATHYLRCTSLAVLENEL